jgi:Mg2+ and Co2+ transporter CorA
MAFKPIPSLNWFDIPDPASPDLDELARQFSLHELQIDDTRHPPQRAKTEEHDGYIFGVLKKLKSSEEVEFDDFDVLQAPISSSPSTRGRVGSWTACGSVRSRIGSLASISSSTSSLT